MTTTLGEWGRLQVVINDQDVTFVRGVPTQIQSWSSGDPFDDATCSITFPGISPFERLGAGELFWCQPHALIDINLIRPGGEVHKLWEGMFASVNDDSSDESASLTIECIGALYQLDYYIRSPQNRSVDLARLYEHAITEEFHPETHRPALRIGACSIEYPPELNAEDGTEWMTQYSGAWEKVLTGYIQRLLADMVHTQLDENITTGQWTLMKNEGRQPVLRIRDEKKTDWTVNTGVPGVVHAIKQDHSQITNVIYGEGSDESDTTWRNAQIDLEETEEGLLPITRYYPLGWDESVHPAERDVSESGEPTPSVPDQFNENFVRVETNQQYGGGVSLRDARRSAQQQVRRELSPGYFGTLSLRTDPMEGSRFEIKAGDNIFLRHFRGNGADAEEIFLKMRELDIFLEDDRFGIMTRGQYATILVKLLEYSDHPPPAAQPTSFSDVAGTTHQESIERLEVAGIAVGYGDGTYGPNDDISRGQLAGMMVRCLEWARGTELSAQHSYFYDIEGNLYEDDINKAAENHIIVGNPNGTYRPNQPASRQQGATILQRMNRLLGGTILADREGVLFHVSQAEINFESGSAELTIDSRFRDLATLSEVIERNKSVNKNPAKMLMANRESSQTDDTKFPWDYNAQSGAIPKGSSTPRHGVLPRGTPNSDPNWFVYVNGAASDPWHRWTIVPVVAAGKGTVQSAEIRAYNASGQPLEIPFHVGVYSLYITEFSMPQQPFAEDAWRQPADSGDALTGYDPSAIVLWGQHEQRAGYWPGLESEGDSPTGILIDQGSWQFQLPEGENVLYVAFYAEDNAYFQGRFFHGVQ